MSAKRELCTGSETPVMVEHIHTRPGARNRKADWGICTVCKKHFRLKGAYRVLPRHTIAPARSAAHGAAEAGAPQPEDATC